MLRLIVMVVTIALTMSLCGCAGATTQDTVEPVATADQVWLPLDDTQSGTLSGVSVTTTDVRVYGSGISSADWAEAEMVETESGELVRTRPDVGHLSVVLYDTVSGIPYSRVLVMYYDENTVFHLVGTESGETTAGILESSPSWDDAQIDYHVEQNALFIDRIELDRTH